MGWEADAVQRQYDIGRSSIPTGGGGMDPIIGSSLIGAGSSIASSVTGGKAAKEAAKSQERAQAAALAFAREQEQTRQNQYQQGFKMWYASQQALRERYGLPPLPPMEAFPTGGSAAAPAEPRMAAARRPGMVAAPPVGATLGEMAGVGVAAPEPSADLGSWNEWANYRLNA